MSLPVSVPHTMFNSTVARYSKRVALVSSSSTPPLNLRQDSGTDGRPRGFDIIHPYVGDPAGAIECIRGSPWPLRLQLEKYIIGSSEVTHGSTLIILGQLNESRRRSETSRIFFSFQAASMGHPLWTPSPHKLNHDGRQSSRGRIV